MPKPVSTLAKSNLHQQNEFSTSFIVISAPLICDVDLILPIHKKLRSDSRASKPFPSHRGLKVDEQKSSALPIYDASSCEIPNAASKSALGVEAEASCVAPLIETVPQVHIGETPNRQSIQTVGAKFEDSLQSYRSS